MTRTSDQRDHMFRRVVQKSGRGRSVKVAVVCVWARRPAAAGRGFQAKYPRDCGTRQRGIRGSSRAPNNRCNTL